MVNQMNQALAASNQDLVQTFFIMAAQNFRGMSIILEARDLINRRSSYKEPRGAFESLEMYLNHQFLSVKDNFLRPLIDNIEKFSNNKHSNKYSSIHIYKNVKLDGFEVNDNSFGVKISFQDPSDWQFLKTSMFGKLVILTRDNFKTIFLTNVISCNEKDLQEGHIFIEPAFVTDVNSDIYGHNYIALVTNEDYQSYLGILFILQKMNSSIFPMPKYIIKNEACYTLPIYLQNATSLIFQNKLFSPINFTKLDEITSDQNLDNSQLAALKAATTQEFSVIKGATGTGKTFLATKMIDHFLDNEKTLKNSSIVVICATNHGLDQILKNVLKRTESVVRVGNETEDDILKLYTLRAKRKQMSIQDKSACALMYRKKHEIEEILGCLQKLNLYAKSFTASHEAIFQTCIKDLSSNKFKSSQEFITWLSERSLNSLIKNASVENRTSGQSCNNFEKNKYSLSDNDLNINHTKNKSAEPCSQPTFMKDLKNLTQDCSEFQQKSINNAILINPRTPIDHTVKEGYWKSLKSCFTSLIESIRDLEKKYFQEKSSLEFFKQSANVEVFQAQKVIGVVAGSTSVQLTLRSLKSPIVLVDEAEKIREVQIVCLTSPDCQQLIILGDDFSCISSTLLKRMIGTQENYVSLNYQHRMRPEIGQLVSSFQYKTNANNEFQEFINCTNDYNNVKGMDNNIFFLNHNHSQAEDGVNIFEVDFFVELAQYLIRAGYNASDITIISTCCRQANAFLKRQKDENLKELQVSTVWDYLGKESKIILLSIVKNSDCKIDYFKYDKAAYAACSRASEGLFIAANNRLINGDWMKIKQMLIDKQAFGESLVLKCQNHPSRKLKAKTGADIKKFAEGCSQPCSWLLQCGHSCPRNCHTINKDHKDIECTEKCTRSCPNNHPCLMTCVHTCQPCRVEVECLLKCGHTVRMPCSDDPDLFPCSKEADALFSACSHPFKKPCGVPIDNYECTHKCEIRLACGHACAGQCHAKSDPLHLEYKCMKNCARINKGCTFNHICESLCYEDCQFCTVVVNKPRSCKHMFFDVHCSENIEKLICELPCNRMLACGHKCMLPCFSDCSEYKCKLMVKKKSPCGHFEKEVKCQEEVVFPHCEKRCQKKLPCGHSCVERCQDPCTEKCDFQVQLSKPGLCGHFFPVPCYIQELGHLSREVLHYCEEPCTAILSCGHRCQGNCSSCKNGRMHILCKEPCNTALQCGHNCEIPCDKECQPCLKSCELKCSHSKCNNRCIEPCFPCQEKCALGCEHKRCTKRCNEKCSIEPCLKPCKKILRCNHQCIGFCGEPCPPLCITCDYDVLKEIYPDHVKNLNARYVLLPDCGHSIESENLLKHVMESADDRKIQFKSCPQCSHPILNCSRIANYIKDDIKDFNFIKSKVFFNDDENSVLADQRKYLDAIQKMQSINCFNGFDDLKVYLKTFEGTEFSSRKISCYEVDVLRIIMETLSQLSRALEMVVHHDSFESIKSKVSELVRYFPTKLWISTQRISDIQSEIRRLLLLIAVGRYSFLTHESNGINRQTVLDKLHSPLKFTNESDSIIVKWLNNPNYLSGKKVIKRKAVFKNSQWFKCTDGHYYSESETNADGMICPFCADVDVES